MSNRRVYCWGNNANGELGVGMSTSRSLTPVQVQGLTGAVSISVGQTHSCAVTSSGAVFCWGDGVNGALGTGSMDDAFGAVEVTALASTAVQVAAGQANTCAVLMDGTIQCWGQGTNGVLGDGTMALRSVPGAVSGIDNAVNVDVGVDSACAVLSTGRVKCWGGNGFRKLGQDSPAASSSVPLEIRSDWISTAQQVEVGQNHACARTSTRTLVCWGSSADGRLGRSTLESFGLPDMATPTSEVVEISLLLDFAALRERSTGNIRLWGAGLGGGEASVLATVDAFPGQAISLGVGVAHVCGVNDSHRVYCWGRNSSGQLGDGTLTEQLAPGLRRAVSFSL